MNRPTLSLLVTLNVVLLAALALVWHDQQQPAQARAQFGGGGNFTMVAGDIRQGDEDVIYIIDQDNGNIAAIQFNGPRDELRGVGVRDLKADIKRLQGGGR